MSISQIPIRLYAYKYLYSDTSRGRLCWFKIDEAPAVNADLTSNNSQSFEYKAALAEKTDDGVNNTNSSVKKQRQLFH